MRKNLMCDYDGTYAAMPEAFKALFMLADSYGYDVYIVTMRSEEDPIDVDEETKKLVKAIIYTDQHAKIDYCRDLGLKFDIFIEDKPISLYVSYPTIGELDQSNSK